MKIVSVGLSNFENDKLETFSFFINSSFFYSKPIKIYLKFNRCATLVDIEIEKILSKAKVLKNLNLLFREVHNDSQIYINNKILRPLKEKMPSLKKFSLGLVNTSYFVFHEKPKFIKIINKNCK